MKSYVVFTEIQAQLLTRAIQLKGRVSGEVSRQRFSGVNYARVIKACLPMQRIVLKIQEKDLDLFFKAGLEEANLTKNGFQKGLSQKHTTSKKL